MSASDTPYGGTAFHQLPAHLPDKSPPPLTVFIHLSSCTMLTYHLLCACTVHPYLSIHISHDDLHISARRLLQNHLQLVVEIVLRLLCCLICWGITLQDGDLLPPRVEPGSDYPLRHRFSLQQALCSFFRQNEANSSHDFHLHPFLHTAQFPL